MLTFADITIRTGHSSSDTSLTGAIIWLVCIGVVCWLLWWLLDFCKVPEPFNKVGRVLIALVAVVFLIRFVIAIAGSPF